MWDERVVDKRPTGRVVGAVSYTHLHSDHLGVERQQMLDAKLLIHAVLGVVVDKLDTVKLLSLIHI